MYLINYHMNELKNQVSILHTIGKLDLISTEKCRKGFAKKNPNLYEPYEAQFVTNAAETLGWDVLEAHSIWNLLKEFNFSNTLKLTNILGLNLKNGPHKKTKMKRYIYNLIKQAVDYQYVLKFGDNPPFFEEEDMNKLKNYVDGELRDLVDKAEFEEKAESILVQMGDFHPVVAHGIVSSMEKEQEWFYSTRKAQFVEKGKALSFSEEELNAVWDNLVISAKSFELN